MMNRFFLVLISAISFMVSCSSKQEPYLKHKIAKSEKISEGCEQYSAKFSMTSNIIGERYEFEKCLLTTYDGHYSIERKGDTIDVHFTKADGREALYKISFDIDAYPRYHFLTIDGTTFSIVPAAN